ncbi:MAG: hypothetical protein HOL80_03950 [Candidatus Magasanikbacteria bacterium]|jgi:hypothetical protein|nr:hypothetical protein [Candidatus Magasanikbacteria bacterium]
MNKKDRKRRGEIKSLLVFAFSFTIFIFVTGLSLSYVKGVDKWIIISKIPHSFRVVGRKGLRFFQDLPYIKYEFQKHGLPVYNLKVDEKDLRFLRSNIPDASEQMTDEYKVYVPATFEYGSKEYGVRIRNRGVSKNHWLWPKKSIRVQFNDDLFQGIKNLNLITPTDRLYLVEEFNHYRAKRLGLFVPRSFFVVVTTNSKDSAIYWAVEHYEKEMLETAQMSSDANFYGEGDAYIQETLYDFLYSSVFNWKKYNNDVRFSEDNYADIDLLINLINSENDTRFANNIFSVVDEDSFYAWSVHNALVFGQHQDWGHNIRLYFDSSVGKFKFVPIDVGMKDVDKDLSGEDFFEEHTNHLMNKILSFPRFMRERNKRLWNYLSDDNNLKEELEYYDHLYERTKVAFYQDKIRRMNNQHIDRQVSEYRRRIVNNTEKLRKLFTEVEIRHSFKRVGEDVKTKIYTKTLSPIILKSAVVSGVKSVGGDIAIIDENNKVVCRDVDLVEEGKIVLECDPNMIFPDISQVQLEAPDNVSSIADKYFKANKVNEKRTSYRIIGAKSEKIRLEFINLYTNEVSSLDIN